MQISWKIQGEQQMMRRLRTIRIEMKDWTPAFKKTADELKGIFSNDVFRTEGGAIGRHWPALKPASAAKTRKGMLDVTGRMRKSFETLYKADKAVVWNSVFYFKYHQSNKPRRKLPRREMMRLGHQQRELIQKIFHSHFKKKIA